eukprot:TRINITY_DN11064_c0_g1_i1.p2 TRINITY_DN11064_c0_g1~~TRINITY_DN11064_c0_g1_i1.p2  ORF type:complete len:134 (+),score=43.74 TRINITY_DN11064_c0_g1_i1:96-497(+)
MDFDRDNEYARYVREKRGRGHARDRRREEEDMVGAPAKSMEGWILFVSGVHEDTEEDELYDLFGEFGDVKNLHLNLDRRTWLAKGYAFVEFDDLETAETAIESVDGQEFNGQRLSVSWAFLKPGPVEKANGQR